MTTVRVLGILVVMLLALKSCSSPDPDDVEMRLTSICKPEACQCLLLSNKSIKATCHVNNLTDLNRFITRPEMVVELAIVESQLHVIPGDAFSNFTSLISLSLLGSMIKQISDEAFKGLHKVTHVDLSMNHLERWQGDLQEQLPSLLVLNITGNTNWVLPEDFMKHRTLRRIIGVFVSSNCSSCLLAKELRHSNILTSGKGFVFSKDCLDIKYTLNQNYQIYTVNHFFPVCITENEQCLQDIGKSVQRNRCLEVRRAVSFVFFLVGIVSLILNVSVIVIIMGAKQLRSIPSLILVVNICVIDFVISGNCLLIATTQHIPDTPQREGDMLCRAMTFFSSTSFLSQSLASLIITVERYLTIVFCMRPNIRMNKRSVLWILITTWLLAVVGGGWFASLRASNKHPMEIQDCALQMFRDKIPPAIVWYTVALLLISFTPVIPLYIHMFLVVKKSGRRVGLKRDIALAKRISLVVGTNLIFLNIPVLYSFVALVNGHATLHAEWSDKTNEIILATFYLCYLTNSLANPCLYGFGNRTFKIAAKTLWVSLCAKLNGNRHNKPRVVHGSRDTKM